MLREKLWRHDSSRIQDTVGKGAVVQNLDPQQGPPVGSQPPADMACQPCRGDDNQDLLEGIVVLQGGHLTA